MKNPDGAASFSPVIIVFGRSKDSDVAWGARFRAEDGRSALAAAMDRDLSLMMSSDEETRRFAEELPEGTFDAAGSARIRVIAWALYERFAAFQANSFDEPDWPSEGGD